jgi:hypothetical protein
MNAINRRYAVAQGTKPIRNTTTPLGKIITKTYHCKANDKCKYSVKNTKSVIITAGKIVFTEKCH